MKTVRELIKVLDGLTEPEKDRIVFLSVDLCLKSLEYVSVRDMDKVLLTGESPTL